MPTQAALSTPGAVSAAAAVAHDGIQSLIGAAPFGSLQAKTEAPKKVAIKPPEPVRPTRLNIKLSGVLAFSTSAKSYAILRVDGNTESVFGIGDRIGNSGATLAEVRSDRVLIDNRGQIEEVPMPIDAAPINVATSSPSSGPSVGSNASGASGTSNFTASRQSPQPSSRPLTIQDNGATIALPESPGALRDYLAQNPRAIGQLMSVAPVRENGRTIGYRLSPKQSGGVLEQYGIQGGDVVTQINGIDLTSQRRGINAMRTLMTADNLQLTVRRGGAQIPISVSLQ